MLELNLEIKMEKIKGKDTDSSEMSEFPFSVWLSQSFHLLFPSHQ